MRHTIRLENVQIFWIISDFVDVSGGYWKRCTLPFGNFFCVLRSVGTWRWPFGCGHDLRFRGTAAVGGAKWAASLMISALYCWIDCESSSRPTDKANSCISGPVGAWLSSDGCWHHISRRFFGQQRAQPRALSLHWYEWNSRFLHRQKIYLCTRLFRAVKPVTGNW